MIADKVDEKYVPSVYQKLSEDFGVLEKTKVKLSIGESSRALIRRIPKIMLVKDFNNPDLSFVLEMAKKKGVPIRKYDTKDMNASPSYNDFYFISDLDRTLIYSKERSRNQIQNIAKI